MEISTLDEYSTGIQPPSKDSFGMLNRENKTQDQSLQGQAFKGTV